MVIPHGDQPSRNIGASNDHGSVGLGTTIGRLTLDDIDIVFGIFEVAKGSGPRARLLIVNGDIGINVPNACRGTRGLNRHIRTGDSN